MDADRDATGWPLVMPDDDGIRPAGTPGECFYCQQAVGQPHERDCVVVTKRVRLRYTFEVIVEVPHAWDQTMIEFHRNESSWSSSNALVELDTGYESFEATYLGEHDATSQRKRVVHTGITLPLHRCTCGHLLANHRAGGACYDCATCLRFTVP